MAAAATAAAAAAASAAEARIQRQFVELQHARLRDLDSLQARLRREFDTLKMANAAKTKQLSEITMELSQVDRIASERDAAGAEPPTAVASAATAKRPPAAPGSGSPGKGSRSRSATATARTGLASGRSRSPRAKTPGPGPAASDASSAGQSVFGATGSVFGGNFGASTLGASPAVLSRMDSVRDRISEADDECTVSEAGVTHVALSHSSLLLRELLRTLINAHCVCLLRSPCNVVM